MIAFGTLKKKSAFKLLARAKDIPAQTANEITQQIEKYETDLKYADDDDKENIDIYNYVESQYHDYIKQSEEYWGIIADRKKAPSAYLLYQGDISKEIGLIRCKSESTKKDTLTCVMDGSVAEEYKFLKNDLLVVNVVDLIDRLFKATGEEHFGVNELLKRVKDNPFVWRLYSNGYTMGINQCEKEATALKATRYKPKNVSELAAFIAGIRPGFKSMYPIFESRVPFSYGVVTLDNLLITEEIPTPYCIFQEQVMKILNYAGFPMDECYSLIKAIAKKKVDKVKAIKDDFIKMFAEKLIADENLSESKAYELSAKVWQIVDDNSSYSFNAAHAYAMALDSLYCAYLKATHPYEFYQVLLQYYSDKGNKDKVAELKQEMNAAFGIREGLFKFGNDNRRFVADEKNNVIYSSLLSLKNMSQKLSDDLYKLSQTKTYSSFTELLPDLKAVKSLKSDQLRILINIDYFRDFGTASKLNNYLDIYEEINERAQFPKEFDKWPEVVLPYRELIVKYCGKETRKQYGLFDYVGALKELWDAIPEKETTIVSRIQNEYKYFGYVQSILPKIASNYYCVLDLNNKYKKYTVALYQLKTGRTIKQKMYESCYFDCGEFNNGDIIKVTATSEKPRWKRDGNGGWEQSGETDTFISEYLIGK